jgi:hypothetical protein
MRKKISLDELGKIGEIEVARRHRVPGFGVL